MTFKPDDCAQCRNRGYYVKALFNQEPWLMGDFNKTPPSPQPTYDTVEVSCDCHYGREHQIWIDRMKHPEYLNPFLSMSDDEILEALSESSANQRAIDKEFDL